MSESINLVDVLNPINFAPRFGRVERDARDESEGDEDNNRVSSRRGRANDRARSRRPQPAVLVELGQRGRALTEAEPAEPGDETPDATRPGALTPRQQFTQALRTLTNPAPAGEAGGAAGGVVTVPVGLDRATGPAPGGVRSPLTQGPRRGVPLAASFANTALGNTPGAREDIVAPAARPPLGTDTSVASQRFTLGGNGPVRPGAAPGIQQAQGPLGRIQERTTNPGAAFGPAARVANRLNNPGPGGLGGAALNASPQPGIGGPAIGGVGGGLGLTDRGNLRGGANPGIATNRTANLELGGTIPSLTPQTPQEIAEAARTSDIPRAAPEGRTGSTETDGPASRASDQVRGGPTPAGIEAELLPGGVLASITDDRELRTLTPSTAPPTPTEIANATLDDGQEVAAITDPPAPTTIRTPDEAGPANVPAAVATDLELVADVNPAQAPQTPTGIANETPGDGQEVAAVNAPEAPLVTGTRDGTGEAVTPLVGITNDTDLVGGIVPLTPESPTDAAEEAVRLPGLPEEENPGIATAITREPDEPNEADEADADRAPAAVVANRELRNTQQTPQTPGETAAAALRVSQGPTEVTGPAETNTILPERLAGPEPAEIAAREPEAPELGNNPLVGPPAVAEEPEPAPEPETVAVAPAVAPAAAPTNPENLAAESPAPAPGARPDENSPAGQQALVAQAVAAFEAQQLAARSDEPVETRALGELFI